MLLRRTFEPNRLGRNATQICALKYLPHAPPKIASITVSREVSRLQYITDSMNPSNQNDRGQKNQTPSAEQLLASADAKKISTETKRAAIAVSNFEIPRESPPEPALDRSRDIRTNLDFDPQQQLDPPISPLLLSSMAENSQFTIDGIALQQQLDTSTAPLPPSPPLVASILSCNVMNSAVAQSSSAVALPPATSYPLPLSPTMALAQPIMHMSEYDQRSPTVQAMLQEAFNEGRSEGRRENEVKLDEAEKKIEQLRERLDPSKMKAAYNRGVRDGSIAGYNKYSMNPETKPSDGRLAFEKILQEKDKAIQNQQTVMAGYQKELTTRKQRIENLEVQVNTLTPQHASLPQDQSVSGQQDLNTEARFSAQRQEIAIVRGQNDLMKADLDNWQVQWGLITANLEEWKAAFNAKAGQLDSCQRELEKSSRELREAKDGLADAKAEEVGSLKASAMESESKFNKLNFDFNSLDRLYTTLAAERSAENEAMKIWNEEQEGIEANSKRTLMDELENKNAQLSDAEKQIRELSQILFADASQLRQSLPSAPVSSPLHEASPASKPSLPSTSTAEGSRSSFHLFRLPATDAGTKFSPYRLLLILFMFLLVILGPYLHSLGQQTNEDTNSWEAINEVRNSGSRDDRIRWEAWVFDNLEQHKGNPSSQEEGWRRTEEIGKMGGWSY